MGRLVKNIAHNEEISKKRLQRWMKLWVPYNQLSEEDKKSDCKYADKVIEILKGV